MTSAAVQPGAPAGQFDSEACVIGAGPSGLAAGKALADRGISFDWFEKGSMVGGLWRIDNDNGGAAAYQTLHLNSSRPLTQFPSFPMPLDWPDYPSHELMASYFQDFADHFSLTERITFNCPVTSVVPLPGPGRSGSSGWSVTTPHGTRTYRSVAGRQRPPQRARTSRSSPASSPGAPSTPMSTSSPRCSRAATCSCSGSVTRAWT